MFIKRAIARGITYLQLVESVWVNGRSKHRLLKSLGREDELDKGEIDRLRASLKRYGSEEGDDQAQIDLSELELHSGKEVGRLLPLEAIWRKLKLGELIKELAASRRFSFAAESVIKAIVFMRVLSPGSERALVRSWLRSVYDPEFEGIELQHTYRALTFLAEVGQKLEAKLTQVMTDKLFADASLLLFDTTSTYFETTSTNDLVSFGFPRDKRADRPRVGIGLLTSREGLPLAHWLYPGKQPDVVSMAKASTEFRHRLNLGSFVLVADRGMVSETNLRTLREQGITYIIAERLKRAKAREALKRAGRYKRVSPNLEVKEIKQSGHERLLLCRNLEAVKEDAREREAIVSYLEEQLATGSYRKSLKASARRYLKLEADSAEIDFAKVKADAKLDGKWVLRTTTSLPPEEVALAYRGLWRIERTFRTLKTPLELRPMFHHSEAGIRGHVQACMLAYVIHRILDDRLEASHLTLNVDEALSRLSGIQRATITVGRHRIERTSVPDEEQKEILKALRTPLPEPIRA